jgi:hypothetical protein
MENQNLCISLESPLTEVSAPYPLLIRLYFRIKHFLIASPYRLRNLIRNRLSKIKNETNPSNTISPEDNSLNLQPGELVEVRSFDEISATLDEKRKHKGLYLMPVAEKYCGGKFKVYKKVEIIKLESTGEFRKIKYPTVILEGVYCNGEHHEGCDRTCFLLWREVWLKRIIHK